MAEIIDSLADRTDSDLLRTHNKTLEDLQTPGLMEGPQKSKFARIIAAADIVKAITPMFALCVDLVKAADAKAGDTFTEMEFGAVLKAAHLVMGSRDRVGRKIRHFNTTYCNEVNEGAPAKTLVSIQQMLDTCSGKEHGQKCFTDAFAGLSQVVKARMSADRAVDAKKAAVYLRLESHKVKQLSLWSATPLRDSQAVSLGIILLILIEGKKESVSLVGKASSIGEEIKHIHAVVKAAHNMETMDVEAYAASMERLLGEMWGTAATKSTIESLKETVARLHAHFVHALKQSMKPHAKKVQGVLRPFGLTN